MQIFHRVNCMVRPLHQHPQHGTSAFQTAQIADSSPTQLCAMELETHQILGHKALNRLALRFVMRSHNPPRF